MSETLAPLIDRGFREHPRFVVRPAVAGAICAYAQLSEEERREFHAWLAEQEKRRGECEKEEG